MHQLGKQEALRGSSRRHSEPPYQDSDVLQDVLCSRGIFPGRARHGRQTKPHPSRRRADEGSRLSLDTAAAAGTVGGCVQERRMARAVLCLPRCRRPPSPAPRGPRPRLCTGTHGGECAPDASAAAPVVLFPAGTAAAGPRLTVYLRGA